MPHVLGGDVVDLPGSVTLVEIRERLLASRACGEPVRAKLGRT